MAWVPLVSSAIDDSFLQPARKWLAKKNMRLLAWAGETLPNMPTNHPDCCTKLSGVMNTDQWYVYDLDKHWNIAV